MLPLLAGSVLALALQTPVLAQVATNMVNFYADCGQNPMTGFAATGVTTNDIWNPVSGGFFYTVATDTTSNQTVVDVTGQTVNDNFTITCGGGLFGPGLYGADESGPLTADLFCSCILDFQGLNNDTITVSITGLATNGNYIMYNYGVGGSGNTGGTLTWVDGTGATITATADNTNYNYTSFVENQNYTKVTGQSDGTGSIYFTLTYPNNPNGNPAWNGTQLLPVPPAPIISVQPQSVTNSVGSSALFSVGADGKGLTYQWLLGTTNLTNNSHYTGCTNSVLTINNVGAADAGSYTVTVTGSNGGVAVSTAATLTLSTEPLLLDVQANGSYSGAALLGYAGDVWNQFSTAWGNTTLALADTLGNPTPVVFSLTNSSGSSDDSSGDDGNGAYALLAPYYYSVANSPITITLSGLNTNALYTIFTYDAGSAYGQGATLGGALTGTAPANLTFSTLNLGDDCLGNTNVITDNSGNVTFTVAASADQPYGVFNGLQIEQQPGLTSSSLPVPSLVQPQSIIGIPPGNTARFSVRAIGPGPLTYQWQVSTNGGKNYAKVNDPTVTGATSNTLNFVNLQASESGLYEVVVTGANGSTTSSAAQLTVVPIAQEVYAWQAPVSIDSLTCEQILDGVPGVYFEAEQAGGNNDVVTTTNNNAYTFMSDGSAVTFSDGNASAISTGAWSGTTGNGTFDGVLSGFYPGAGMNLITIYNLTPGVQYSVQLFGLDDESGNTDRQSSYQDPNNNYDASATFTMGADDYVIGTFTATNASMTIQQNLPSSGNGNINAVVVRTALTLGAQVIPGSNGGKLVLTWPVGTLLQATNLTGPWVHSGVTSPYTNSLKAPQLFFRLSNP